MIAAGVGLLLVGVFLRWLDLELVESNLLPVTAAALLGGIALVVVGVLQ